MDLNFETPSPPKKNYFNLILTCLFMIEVPLVDDMYFSK